MATKTVSPGAALLRSSRLFSLPAKLPQINDAAQLNLGFSESATTSLPTMQAIASPRISRKNGDWGLKRPMPPRACSSRQDPLIRIRQLDSIEAITDYDSATGHNRTLRKWQSLHMPITAQTETEQRQQLAGRSVFEESSDIVAIDPADRHTSADKRWKFEGPWLAGITEGEFQTYLKKKVRTRRAEFREFLRQQLAADRNAAAAVEALDLGVDAASAKTVVAAEITDDQLTEYLRFLRHDRVRIYHMVGKFLDLVPVGPSEKVVKDLARSTPSGFLAPLSSITAPSSSSSSSASSYSLPSLASLSSATSAGSAGNPWSQDGPPITHPSAGLSYLRTAAYLDNHPVYGPQKVHPPVSGRVVQPRTSFGSWTAKVGIAGFITDNPFGQSAYLNTRNANLNNSARTIPALSIIDPAIKGGAKVSVRVVSAKVNSHGRMVVSAAEADPEALLVQEELEGKEKIYDQQSRLQSTRADLEPRRFTLGRFGVGAASRTTPSAPPIMSSPENYGLKN
ncbi:hypothetical protein SEPCBS119000_006395 [Sporothrix epigloea]|uniref:Uncharacterized protein n=1 Tax=Sporothrix epigloea TaxID=1892477 RepID=A0ABP0E4R0_9PEZI